MDSYGDHYSVFHQECIECFQEIEDIKNGYIADLTFGAGGHSKMLLDQVAPLGVMGVDQDEDAIQNANKTYDLEIKEQKLILLKMNFQEFPKYWKDHYADKKFYGAVLDLGVSSHQFDNAGRGFSYRFDGPLDMRMDRDSKSMISAEDVVNHYTLEELEQVFKDYGEEKLAPRIAGKILEQRSLKKITTTKELEEIIFHCYPKKWRYGRTHPATKVFQALRIEVNEELRVLETVLPELLKILEIGGRLFVISFHSLEDRITKNVFRDMYRADKSKFKLLTKKPLQPSETEMRENTRSRSAKLRIIEKIG